MHYKRIFEKQRNNNRIGGGTISLSKLNVSIKQEYPINKDCNLLRIVVDNVFIFWIGNIYLNRGSIKQITKLFSVIQQVIPSNELPNTILGGDFNINLSGLKTPQKILLNTLCKQINLKISIPNQNTRSSATLDFLIIGKGIEATFLDQLNSPSDHNIVRWNIKFQCTTTPTLIRTPNNKIAKKVTQKAILNKNISNSYDLFQSFLNLRRKYRRNICIKLKHKTIQNNAYISMLLAIQKEEFLSDTINLYWKNFWQEIESKRYSCFSNEAFETMKRIGKFSLIDKREGSLVNSVIKDNSTITSDYNGVSSILISHLESIQCTTKYPQYSGNLPFPKLPSLTEPEVDKIINYLSSGKALNFDLFSDTAFENKETRTRLNKLVRDLWTCNFNKIIGFENLFKSRLVALNKAHPHTPRREEFRPIIVSSPIIKVLEARWLNKLQNYLLNKLCPSQTGFVPGQGVFTNIYRAIQRIKVRTDLKKPVYGLFIDLRSAYNYSQHDLLFDRLKGILTKDEIQFQKAIYDKLKIQMGNSCFRPNLGVAQGSVISPALFNIYTEPLLW